MDLIIPPEVTQALHSNKAVRIRGIKYPNPKVVTVSVDDTHVRVKITPSLAIAVRDTNAAFVAALFPDFLFDYNELREEVDAVERCITVMRIKMEMRVVVMEEVFRSPETALTKLAASYDIDLRKLFRNKQKN